VQAYISVQAANACVPALPQASIHEIHHPLAFACQGMFSLNDIGCESQCENQERSQFGGILSTGRNSKEYARERPGARADLEAQRRGLPCNNMLHT